MKRHCLFIFPCIILLNVSLCFGGHQSGAQKRARKKARETELIPQKPQNSPTQQQEQEEQKSIVTSNTFLKKDAVASSSTDQDNSSITSFEVIEQKNLDEAIQALKQPQFPLGTFDAEINKGFLQRFFWESRHIRETTEKMITTYDPIKHLLGTGDEAELKRLIIAAKESYLGHNQTRNLALLITFVTQQKIQGLDVELTQERVLSALKTEQELYERKREKLKPLEQEVQRLADTTCKIQEEVTPINAAIKALEELTTQKK